MDRWLRAYALCGAVAAVAVAVAGAVLTAGSTGDLRNLAGGSMAATAFVVGA